MKVKATKRGYFGLSIVEEGKEFDIPDEPTGKDGKPVAFSKRWMEEVDAEVKETKKAKGK